ncbi:MULTISPECIES: fumarylacetoacetate hydrolase family protein [unclassified Mesorhizobium]|uniref:fumarylacetoacetate hydrolase family protein n=1 Tax=unclassified Mesorhizobium TaxID=325217 RepID=UPI001091E24A|nr:MULTISPECIES: fumarylacetoacetate hydrolase family protein [unclassified Mesorhizobium]TGQ28179.1 FAA hydrolase family protein [Mesorhizobium sp. M4B.F.Ca.ET.214.01.1.1]TGQ55359.1 FAA hydrolase family protein [Mesorhizobium sp. M4B.F.Ca.ET.211.01.1.1]TGU28713.1 FAA hydrolase family protein [Mesorhizobium sp. M4B.F.Ca.ET.150.01.1.1]TIX16705.1 MAG: fumarylacetoacetate hydrolase family protein [Mesorhizobium sp.]
MRFRSLRRSGALGVGVLVGKDWRGAFENETGYVGSLDQLVARGREGLLEAFRSLREAPVLDEAAVEVLPPLRTPPKIVCVGLNYSDHTAESGYKQPEYPTFFPRFASSLIGHDVAMVRPRVSDTLDFEGELAVVIGVGGRHIAKADALSHVLGYSVFNDGSVREYQFKTPQWTIGKNFDSTGSFGPDLVTTDELPEGAAGLQIETRLNGEVVQSASIDQLIFDVATLIATLSEAVTLEVGDVIVTGTPSGIGHARNPKLYMKPGDICEVEIERVGLLRNRILDEGEASGLRAA